MTGNGRAYRSEGAENEIRLVLSNSHSTVERPARMIEQKLPKNSDLLKKHLEEPFKSRATFPTKASNRELECS